MSKFEIWPNQGAFSGILVTASSQICQRVRPAIT